MSLGKKQMELELCKVKYTRNQIVIEVTHMQNTNKLREINNVNPKLCENYDSFQKESKVGRRIDKQGLFGVKWYWNTNGRYDRIIQKQRCEAKLLRFIF